MTRAELLAFVTEVERDPDLAARLARVLAPHVFRAGASAAQTTAYSTRAGGAPPGYSRDGWRALARKIGHKRGRYWYVTQAELDAFERSPKPANDSPTTSAWTPAHAARALALRPAGGAR